MTNDISSKVGFAGGGVTVLRRATAKYAVVQPLSPVCSPTFACPYDIRYMTTFGSQWLNQL